MEISAVILAKNSAETLFACLSSLSAFSEVVVADTGSLDETEAIAKSFPNVRFCQIPFEGFGKSKNRAIKIAKHSWILSIDSDEVLSEFAMLEISKLTLREHEVYSFPFHNYLFGKWIKGCGWYPDRHTRLFNKKKTAFSDDSIHEGIITKGLVSYKLQNPILHFSYRSISDFIRKMDQYSSLFALGHKDKKKSSFAKAFFHGLWAFTKSYFFQRGFLLGKEGFLISAYQCQTAFYKYMKLWQINNE